MTCITMWSFSNRCISDGANACIETLLEARASVNECTDFGIDCLAFLAFFDGDASVARHLLLRGADANRRIQAQTSKASAVYVVARLLYRFGCAWETVRVLAEAADATSLHMAAINGNQELCEIL